MHYVYAEKSATRSLTTAGGQLDGGGQRCFFLCYNTMQSVLIICGLYAKCPYYVVVYMQSVLII